MSNAIVRQVEVVDDVELARNTAAYRRSEVVDQLSRTAREWEKAATMVYEYDHDECWKVLGFKSMWASLKDEAIRFDMGDREIFKCRARGKAVAQGAPKGSSAKALDQFAKLNHDREKQAKAFKSASASSFTERVTETGARKAVSRLLPSKKKAGKRTKAAPMTEEATAMLKRCIAHANATIASCDEEAVPTMLGYRNVLEGWL